MAAAENSERNQRAVYCALMGMTSDSALLLECWHTFARAFRDAPTLPVGEYVAYLSGQVGLDSRQADALAGELAEALRLNLGDLPQLPAHLRAA